MLARGGGRKERKDDTRKRDNRKPEWAGTTLLILVTSPLGVGEGGEGTVPWVEEVDAAETHAELTPGAASRLYVRELVVGNDQGRSYCASFVTFGSVIL